MAALTPTSRHGRADADAAAWPRCAQRAAMPIPRACAMP
jgi:hypothetical protein